MTTSIQGLGGSRISHAGDERERRIRLFKALLLVLVVLGFGTGGYHILTGGVHTLTKCFYMTVITVSTVGYGEVIPVTDSESLQLFTSVLILLGGGGLVYFLSSFTAIVIEGDLAHGLWRRRMERKLSAISDHVVVAGMTMTGMNVVRDLVENGVPVVAIDSDAGRMDRLLMDVGENVLVVLGDPLQESVLATASLPKSRGVIACMADDRDNLLLTLTIRGLAPDTRVVAKIEDAANEAKFTRVGADAVVNPAFMGGQRLVSQTIRPSVVSLADALFTEQPMHLAQLTMELAGEHTVASIQEMETVSAVILGVASGPNEACEYNPSPDTRMVLGSAVIALGTEEELATTRAALSGAG